MSSVNESSTRLFWLIVLSVFCSPIAVLIEFGLGQYFLINLLLWLLIPFGGFIHAAYLLSKRRYERSDYEPVNSDLETGAGSEPNQPEPESQPGAPAPGVEPYHDAPKDAKAAASTAASSSVSTENSRTEDAPTSSAPIAMEPLKDAHHHSSHGSAPLSSPPPYHQGGDAAPLFDNKVQHN